MYEKDKKYFVSFVEEGIMNSDYYDCVGGRVEIMDNETGKTINEIRFLTRHTIEFSMFRNIIDFERYDGQRIRNIIEYIQVRFQDAYGDK